MYTQKLRQHLIDGSRTVYFEVKFLMIFDARKENMKWCQWDRTVVSELCRESHVALQMNGLQYQNIFYSLFHMFIASVSGTCSHTACVVTHWTNTVKQYREA